MSSFQVDPGTAQIDAAYRAQRLRLSATVAAGVATAWAQLHEDRAAALHHVVTLVVAGQAHVVRLVDAYMAARSQQTTGRGEILHLDPRDYTADAIRGVPLEKLYSRPFGAYGAFIKDGARPVDALRAAQASVSKLARTDLQLAQTHAARDWMQRDKHVVGWRRVLNGDTNCALCTAASTRRYYIADLMPIHENCDCTVEPVWGDEPNPRLSRDTAPTYSVRVELDPELGPRLLAEGWASVGPLVGPT